MHNWSLQFALLDWLLSVHWLLVDREVSPFLDDLDDSHILIIRNYDKLSVADVSDAENPRIVDSLLLNFLNEQQYSSVKVIKDDAEACVVELQLVNNFELRNWILGFGASVKVVEPQSLKDQIREELQKAVSGYWL